MPTEKKTKPIPFTSNIVKAALRDARARVETARADGMIPGLAIRTWKDGTCKWSVRTRLYDKQRRYDLGQVCEGDRDKVPAICLKTARSRAFKVKEICGAGLLPTRQLEAWAAGTTVERLERDAPPSWEWDHAKKEFFAWLKAKRRPDTLKDYRTKLRDPVFNDLAGRAVASMTANELLRRCQLIADRGHEPMATGAKRTISAFFSWLSHFDRQHLTNVKPGMFIKAGGIEADRDEIGDPTKPFNPEDEAAAKKVPSPIELGRALVVARSGVLPEIAGLGIQVLLGSVQRRHAVTGASGHRMKRFPEKPLEEAWFVPPYFRKTGRSKRSGSSHLVPLVGWVAEAIRTLDRKIPHEDDANPFLFPQRRKGRQRDDDEFEIDNPTTGEKMHRHRTESFLNRWLESIPGIDFSTHGGRYAFTTYGEGQLGFKKSEGKIILDHMEGVEPDDVTGLYYSTDPAIARKREMMTAWVNFLDRCAAAAIAADPLLLDTQHLQEAVFMQKYCRDNDDRLKRRIAYCEKRRIPLWGVGAPELRDAA
jgi:hypothetical protein